MTDLIEKYLIEQKLKWSKDQFGGFYAYDRKNDVDISVFEEKPGKWTWDIGKEDKLLTFQSAKKLFKSPRDAIDDVEKALKTFKK